MTDLICFGEILWDVFPDRKVIGGAPLNVVLRAHSLGARVGIISRLGEDEDGEKALHYIKEQGVSTDWIQKDADLPTGNVQITLDESGSASYVISKPVAWDNIRLSREILHEVREASLFLFGSLALRGLVNRDTISVLLNTSTYKVFDVNLRAPHYDISMIYELMQRSDFVKMNDEELGEICTELGCQETTMKSQILWLEKVSSTCAICVTRGGDGALLYWNNEFYDHPGYKVEVADTVGAGDSFLATLINELLINKHDAPTSLAKACAVGALVASKEGANCEVKEEEIEDLISSE